MTDALADALQRADNLRKQKTVHHDCVCTQNVDGLDFPPCAISQKPRGGVRWCERDKQDRDECQCKACGGIIGLAIESGSGLGDALIVTEALHATRKAYPTLPVAVITGHAVVFENSPDVTHTIRRPHKAKFFEGQGKGYHYVHATKTPGKIFPNYGTWLDSRKPEFRRHAQSDWNNDPDTVLCNAVTNTCYLVNHLTPLRLQEMGRRPRLYLTPQERTERPLERPYWLVVSGAESSKEPRIELLNAVVEKTGDKVHWVQFGYDFKRAGWTCKHPTIKGVAEDRRGRLPERDFFRWIYHAQGILCPEGGLSHTAAAVGTPCIVLLGGRSTPGWVDYPGQSAFHTIGRLACCQSFACWTKRCKWDRACYLLIDPAEVAETVLWHDKQQSYPSDLAQSRIEQPSGFAPGDFKAMMSGGNRTAFLACAGPSLDAETATMLDEPGLAVMAVNRAVNVLRHPTYFTMCDSWDRYEMDIWNNPTLTKFVRTSQAKWLEEWPRAIYSDWKEELPAEAMFDGPQIPLGIKFSGLRSTMCAAMSVLIRLGYTTINVIGADFSMDGDQHYCDGFERTESERKQYLGRQGADGLKPGYFGLLNAMFEKLQPLLLQRGVTVTNCTPGGGLTAFPMKALQQAIDESLERGPDQTRKPVPLAPAPLVKHLAQAVKDTQPATVLELGFGRGETGRAIRTACPAAAITGVEVWQPYVDIAKNREPYDVVIAADILGVLPTLAGNSFDAVVAMEVIEHLTREDADIVIAHCKRIAPQVYASSPIGDFPEEALHGNPFQVHRSTWTEADWLALGFGKLTSCHMRNGSDCALFGWNHNDECYLTTSVIVPVWNAPKAVEQCLNSLMLHEGFDGVATDCYLIDNGSHASTKQVLKPHVCETVRCISNAENVGFGRACNQAARQSHASILVFLNSDVVTEAPWLDKLLAVFADPKVGAAGPSVMTWKQGGIADRDDLWYVDGWCMAVRKDLFLSLGGFDERFGLGYCEDADFGRTLMEAGYEVRQVDLPLRHLRKQSSRQLGKARAALLDRNRRLLREKWKEDACTNSASG